MTKVLQSGEKGFTNPTPCFDGAGCNRFSGKRWVSFLLVLFGDGICVYPSVERECEAYFESGFRTVTSKNKSEQSKEDQETMSMTPSCIREVSWLSGVE